MISYNKGDSGRLEVTGLDSDIKPVDVPNGSLFYEMNTTNYFMFDEETKTWIPQQ